LSAQEYKHIVRIIGNDIPGDKKVLVGLAQVRGVGRSFALAILDTLGISPPPARRPAPQRPRRRRPTRQRGRTQRRPAQRRRPRRKRG